MKQNDTNTQLKDKFKSPTAKRNHYQATIIFQDSHKSEFLALPQSQFLIHDKCSEDAKTEELRVGKAPRQQRDQTPLKCGQLGHSWDATVVGPKKIFLENIDQEWMSGTSTLRKSVKH